MLKIEYVKPSELVPYENNAKLHPAEQIEQIKESIRDFGFNDPIAVWKDNKVIEGHGRLIASIELGLDEVPIIRLDNLTDDERKAYTLVHNKLTMNSGFDAGLLDLELGEIDFDMEKFGFDIGVDDFDPYANGGETGSLQRRFVAPPFSVLDGRQGYWKDRKKYWKDKINDNAETREEVSLIASNIARGATASILDPVLSEIILLWFTPYENAKVFDCFAGDTVFGYVAGDMGHQFTGVELRKEQADLNNARTREIGATYICDDGRNVRQHIGDGTQDLLFSCPPYFDLEVYSDDPNDASNQETYEEFYEIIETAISESVKCLKDDRFAVFVVANMRGKSDSGYYNFVGDVIETFKRNGLAFYNDMVLLDPIGSAGIRSSNTMKYRKVVKVHQNVLVFYKGDPKKIKSIFPAVEVKTDESDDEELEWLGERD